MNRRNFLNWIGLGWLVNTSPALVDYLLAQLKKPFILRSHSISTKSTILYVSPNGNDRWNGKKPNPNKTRVEGPFATLERARDAIRELKKQQGDTLNQKVTVLIRGGTYFLPRTLEFTHEDSGSQNFPVNYQAYQNEKPIISGGQKLQGWQQIVINGKRLWMVEIPQVQQGQWFFRQLWVNGQRRPRARYPKKGYLPIAEVPDVTSKTPWTQGQSRFNYHPGDLKSWSTIANAEIVIMTRWLESRSPVVSIDEEQRLISFAIPSEHRLDPANDSRSSAAATYYLENALEFLDTPGEWYLDKTSGKLYYMSLPGEDMHKLDVIIPRLPRLVDLQGRAEDSNFVEYLSFQNLTFAYSEWYYPKDSKISSFFQAAYGVPGSIYGEGVRYCIWYNCNMRHVSNYGIEFAHGCTNNSLNKCEFFDLGAGGVKVSNGSSDIKVVNCHIYNGGKIFHSAVGILVMNAPDNLISRNHIHDFYYTGISIGWTWGYKDSPTRNNVIEFNHIHNIGLLSNGDGPLLNDKGGIYTLGVQHGTVIRSNIIHDIDAYNYGGWGIYLDEGSSQILVENNLVYRTRDGGFHQHYGKNNSITNNIFALGIFSQVRRTRPEPHLSFTFEHNIVYWNQGELFAGNWDDYNFIFDKNLYWNTKKGNILFGKLSWQDWNKKGMDRYSLIADPLFIGVEKDDFKLKSNSPAFRLGINQKNPQK